MRIVPGGRWWPLGKPDAAEVVAGLWVGSAPSRSQVRRLIAGGITTVVDLRGDDEGGGSLWPETIVYACVPLRDHAAPSLEELEQAGELVADLMRQGDTVLVHCHAGLERSPTVACAALMLLGWSLRDAYRRVTASRTDAAPTEGQLAALRALADRLAAADIVGHRREATPALL